MNHAPGLIATLLEHPRARQVAENVVVVGRQPQLRRSESIRDELRIIDHDLAGQGDQGEIGAELPDRNGSAIVGWQFLPLVERLEHRGRHPGLPARRSLPGHLLELGAAWGRCEWYIDMVEPQP